MLTFKEHLLEKELPPAISFDMDDTIYLTRWDYENKDYIRDEKGNPAGDLNEDIAQKIKDFKVKGYKVFIITSRYAIWRKETEEFLRDNNLMGYIDDVIFTNGAWKAKTCKRNGVKIHFDDDPEEIRRLKYKDIKGIKVKNPYVPPLK